MMRIPLKHLGLFTSFLSICTAMVLLVSWQNEDTSPPAIALKLHNLDTLFFQDFDLSIKDRHERIIYERNKISLPLSQNSIPDNFLHNGETAQLTIHFTESQLMWIKRHSQINLYIPRMIHHSSTIFWPNGHNQQISGYNATLQASFNASDIFSSPDKSLRLDIHYEGYPFFGPQDFSLFFAHPKDAGTILDLLHTPLTHMQLRKQLDLGLCLIIVLLSMILSSHRLFAYLAFLASAYGLRSFFSFYLDMYGSFNASANIALFINLALAVSSLLFFMQFFTLAPLSHRPRLITLMVPLSIILISFALLSKEIFIFQSDLIVDAIISVTGIAILVFSSIKVQKIFRHETHLAAQVECIGREQNAAILLVTVLILYASINIFDLANIYLLQEKSYGHLAHLIFTPGLFLSVFIHGGTNKQKINKVIEDTIREHSLSTELALAQQFQKSLMPDKKGEKALYTWRSFYKGGQTLGGDWMCLQEIRTANDSYILGALFDVAGKGLQSAMLSTVITTSFQRFVKQQTQEALNVTIESEQFLRRLTQQINADLSLLNFSYGASGSIFLIDTHQKTITYATHGYHGFVIGEAGGKTSYLKSAGPAFGSPYFCPHIKQRAITLPCLTIMLSDGFMGTAPIPSAFMRRLAISAFDANKESAHRSLRRSYANILHDYRVTMKYARRHNIEKDDAALLTAIIYPNEARQLEH